MLETRVVVDFSMNLKVTIVVIWRTIRIEQHYYFYYVIKDRICDGLSCASMKICGYKVNLYPAANTRLLHFCWCPWHVSVFIFKHNIVLFFKCTQDVCDLLKSFISVALKKAYLISLMWTNKVPKGLSVIKKSITVLKVMESYADGC